MDGFQADRELLAGALDVARSAIELRLQAGGRRRRRVDAGHSLAAHARSLLTVIDEIQQRAEADFSESEGRLEFETALRKLRRAVSIARHLQHTLGWLDDKPEHLGLGATYLLRELASTLVAPDADLIEEPVDGPTYATLNWPFERFLRDSDDVTLERTSHPIVVFFPRAEAGNTLLVPLVVHELGHPTWLHHRIDLHLWRAITESSGAADSVAAAVRAPEGSHDADTVTLERKDQLLQRLEELFCDALATELLGPTYLLAFTAWAAASGLTDAHGEHPPTLLRLELVLAQLKAAGWDDALAAVPAVEQWLEGLLAEGLTHGRIDEVTVAALRATHPEVIQAARDAAGDSAWTAASYAEQAGALMELLDDDILPAQLDHHGRHASRRSILLASWTHAIGDGGLRAVSELLGDRRQQAFVDKALEMSFVLEQWRSA